MPDTSSETNVPISEWTLGSLKVHHDDKIAGLKELTERRFIEAEKAVNAALTAAKEGVREAKTAQDQQLTAHNGLIRKMEIQTNTFIPRVEADIQFKALEDKIAASIKPLNDYVAARQGQQKGSDKTWAIIVTIIGVGIAILGYLSTKH